MRYIYFDETEFGNNQFIGYGAFASQSEIPNLIISDSMNKLSQDPDIYKQETKKIDELTIKRSYFHASEDSKNAHSHLCSSINNNLNGLFRADLFDKNQNNKKTENILALASNLSSMKALNTREDVLAIFEQRDNLKLEHLELSFESLYTDLLKSCYEYPLIPAFFPKIDFKIVHKNEPGIQCVDFLLWATQRKFLIKDDWYRRIKSRNSYEFENEGKGWIGVNLELNENCKDAPSFYGLADYNKEIDDKINNETLAYILFNAIKIASHFAINTLPTSLSSIKQDLIYLYENKMNENAYGYVKKLAKSILFLFDMIPLIDNSTTKKDKEFLIASKKYLALTLRNELINGVGTSDFLEKVRRLNIREHPDLLN